MLCFDAVVCLSQSVPSLRFRHHIQDLMNGDAGRFQLGQCCGADHVLQKRLLIAMAELQVHRLGGECGEFVAEAHLVDAAHGGGVGEAVVLLLLLVVQDIAQGICDEAVQVIVSTSDDLELYVKLGVFLQLLVETLLVVLSEL